MVPSGEVHPLPKSGILLPSASKIYSPVAGSCKWIGKMGPRLRVARNGLEMDPLVSFCCPPDSDCARFKLAPNFNQLATCEFTLDFAEIRLKSDPIMNPSSFI